MVFTAEGTFFLRLSEPVFLGEYRDYEIDLSMSPFKILWVFFEYHYFTLDESRDAWYTTGLKERRRDISGSSGVELGHELDIRLRLTLWGHLDLIAGYGRFFPVEFIKNTGESPEAEWYFMQTVYSW